MTAVAPVWTPPTPWPVPREWPGGVCLIVCSGESAGVKAAAIRQFRGRVIAVKHGVLLRPDADVFFMSGEMTSTIARELLPKWTPIGQPGHYAIVRGRSTPDLPEIFKRVTRSKIHGELCDRPDHVSGRDTGTSAINLAYLFGATTILLVGYDMAGGHFCPHPLQNPPADHFVRHTEFLHQLDADAKRKGIRIVNCGDAKSRVTAFERQPLEAFLCRT